MLYTLAKSVEATEEMFCTFKEGEKPELIPTGIRAVDAVIGGVIEGTLVLVGAGPGVGKSSVALSSLLSLQEAGIKAGYQSNEDGPDMVGSRVLGRYSNVNSLKIRRKDFTEEEAEMLLKGRAQLREDAKSDFSFLTSYAVSGSLEKTVEGIKALGEAGCKIVFMDYLQKLRGTSGDRRYDIGTILSRLHGAAVESGCALVLLSQVARQMDPCKIPTRFALKESGDIENEARVIVMLAKSSDGGVIGCLDKCSFGGEGTMVKWERRSCGTLWETVYEDQDDF